MRDELDRYYTPPQLVPPLIAHLRLDDGKRRRILEPCAGGCALAKPLAALGHEVVTADLDCGVQVDAHRCGLSWSRRELEQFDLLITNPPFQTAGVHAAELIRHWLRSGVRTVACLLRLSFLEPCAGGGPGSRVDLLTGGQLANVLVLPRAEFDGPAREGKTGTGSVTCAWFIWRVEHSTSRGPKPAHLSIHPNADAQASLF